MKRLLVSLALLAVAGCASSGPCKDVIVVHPNAIPALAYSTYHECGGQCCKPKARECYCSKSCSCSKSRGVTMQASGQDVIPDVKD